MEELLRTIYPDNPTAEIIPRMMDPGSDGTTIKSVDEVWKEIAAGGGTPYKEQQPLEEEMTLEDFLAKAGAVREEDVSVPEMEAAAFPEADSVHFQSHVQQQQQQQPQDVTVAVAERSIRGKRRAPEEPVDKATAQRQRRMIKNRESAARSRERKQAYTVELESLVTKLEEENARLVKEQMEQTRQRLKQLMENLIPVEEKRRPPRILRKTRSMNW